MWKRFYLLLVAALLANEFKPVTSGLIKKKSRRIAITITTVLVFTVIAAVLYGGWGIFKYFNPSTFPQDIKEAMVGMQGELEKLNSQLDDIQKWQHKIMDHIQEIPDLFQHELNVRNMERYLVRLETLIEDYQAYVKNVTVFENSTLLEYATVITSFHPQDSAQGAANQIHSIIQPNNPEMWKTSILFGMAKKLQKIKFDDICKLGQSPQQVVFNFYTHTVAVRGMSIMIRIFAFCILKFFGEGNFDNAFDEMYNKYVDDVSDEMVIVQAAIESLPREYWKCDPPIHIKDKTYIEITNFRTLYVQNERDLNKRMTCAVHCHTLPTPVRSYNCTEPLCNQQQRCNGTLQYCKTVDRPYLLACLGQNNETRRYTRLTTVTLDKPIDNWHEFPNKWKASTVYGKKCSNASTQIPVKSFQDKDKYNCNYCLCYCDEEGKHTDKYFNLRPVMADYKNKWVVTGVRFIKHNQIIHLQIQQGNLTEGGLVNTVRWVPPEDYKINDPNVKDGHDYHTLSEKHRGIYLETVETKKKEEVVVGVRFNIVTGHKYLQMSIAVCSLDDLKGNKKLKKLQWILYTGSRHTLTLQDPDVSYHGTMPSMPSKRPAFIQFTTSSEKKDAGQTTVPTLDAQPVDSQQPVALAGIGLFHKGRNGYGGFIAPLIVQYNLGEKPNKPNKTKKRRKRFG